MSIWIKLSIILSTPESVAKMSARISITTSRDQQAKAAFLLSQYLTEELKCPHAYIGGFAWSLLGNTRATEISPDHSL
jgi:hypothetical protein